MSVAEEIQPKLEFVKLDSVSFMNLGKKMVVDNFNTHRNPERSDPLTVEGVNVIWFVKALGVWKMIISSHLARGLLWEITYTPNAKNEIYLDVYNKLNKVKFSLGTDKG